MRFEPTKPGAYEAGSSKWNLMDNTVYLLWFVPEGEGGEDDALLIGVYVSEPEAKAASYRLQSKPGFSDYTNGFQIHPYEVGRDHWTEGFVRN